MTYHHSPPASGWDGLAADVLARPTTGELETTLEQQAPPNPATLLEAAHEVKATDEPTRPRRT